MSKYDFTKQFTELLERLDMFFHNKLKKAKLKQGIEETKNDLIQETALAVINKLKIEKYNDYSLPALIWTKAGDVWKRFASSQLKKMQSQISVEIFPEQCIDQNYVLRFEITNLINVLKSKTPKAAWEMLVLHVIDGYSYKEIAKQMEISEHAVKMQIFRLKKKLVRQLRHNAITP